MIERKHCPDCGGDLGNGATKCRCGWKAPVAESLSRAARPCQHDATCPYPGRMLVNGKAVCVVHYDAALRATPAREPGCDDEPVHA